MSRPPKCRRVGCRPGITLFKPAGVPTCELEVVEIGLDELEALRLADLEGLYHDAAAERMGVSRATFGRLIERARHKVAAALLGSKAILFTGGPVMNPDDRVFACSSCGSQFVIPRGQPRPVGCPSCKGVDLHRVHEQKPDSPAGPGCGRQRGGRGDRGRGRCVRRRARLRGGALAGVMAVRLADVEPESNSNLEKPQ